MILGTGEWHKRYKYVLGLQVLTGKFQYQLFMSQGEGKWGGSSYKNSGKINRLLI